MAITKANKLTEEAMRLNVVLKIWKRIKRLGACLGISHTKLFRMLNGTQRVTFDVIKAVCFKLGYSVNWMVAGVGPKKLKTNPNVKIVTDIAQFRTELW